MQYIMPKNLARKKKTVESICKCLFNHELVPEKECLQLFLGNLYEVDIAEI